MKKYLSLNLSLVFLCLLSLASSLVLYLASLGSGAETILRFSLIIGGIPILAKGMFDLLKGKLNIDIIAFLAIVGGYLTHNYLAGVIIVLMFSGGNLLEEYAYKKAKLSLDKLIKLRPITANLIKGQDVVAINASKVKIGDLLLVRQGESVPVDGMIIEGDSNLDQANLTGEALPVFKSVNDIVLSSTLNLDHPIKIRAIQTAGRSAYSRVVDLVKKAQDQKAPINMLADIYGAWFTPFVLIFTLITYLVTKDTTVAYSVIVVATPCPLLIATPVAIISGIALSAKKGIIVKSAASLERANGIDTIVFDKTGTITSGNLKLVEIIPKSKIKPRNLISIAAGLELNSPHIIARAINHYSHQNKISLIEAQKINEDNSQGVKGEYEGQLVLVGSADFMAKNRISLDKADKDLLQSANLEGKLVTFIAIKSSVIGILLFSDSIRPNLRDTIQSLRAYKVRNILMLSGDKQTVVDKIAQKIGLDKSFGQLLPQDKVRIIKDMVRKDKKVAMVGDGINDAPALSFSRLGIAMGKHGSAISSEVADVVLTDDNLSKITQFIGISRGTLSIAKQSIIFGMSLSVIAMVLASFGVIRPVTGALLQEAIDVTVILNALRVLTIKISNKK